jgi:hypothetical protein
MDELELILARAFQLRNKSRLSLSELVFALSVDLKWFSQEKSREIIDDALRSGILRAEDDRLIPSFNVREIKVPAGFAPGGSSKALMERIYDAIIASGVDRKAAEDAVLKKLSMLAGYITPEVAGIIVAREHGAEVNGLIDEAYKAICAV